jgi:hypothetical protein
MMLLNQRHTVFVMRQIFALLQASVPLQARLVIIYRAIQLAKAESNAMVEEGRRIMGWPPPVSLRQKLAANIGSVLAQWQHPLPPTFPQRTPVNFDR